MIPHPHWIHGTHSTSACEISPQALSSHSSTHTTAERAMLLEQLQRRFLQVCFPLKRSNSHHSLSVCADSGVAHTAMRNAGTGPVHHLPKEANPTALRCGDDRLRFGPSLEHGFMCFPVDMPGPGAVVVFTVLAIKNALATLPPMDCTVEALLSVCFRHRRKGDPQIQILKWASCLSLFQMPHWTFAQATQRGFNVWMHGCREAPGSRGRAP